MSDANAPSTIKPLQGIRVIDVSSFLAGPFCSTQLAEFGAEVFKLELPVVGDALRKFGTPTPSGDSLPWLQETRNKKVATLDLRTPEGAELVTPGCSISQDEDADAVPNGSDWCPFTAAGADVSVERAEPGYSVLHVRY